MIAKWLELRWRWILIAGAALSVLSYLAFSSGTFRLGFPLDDAWIHQTYARNFALEGRWAFTPGEVSGGSTAPLWTVILSVGYLLGVSPKIWAYAVGGLVLLATALVCVRWFADQNSKSPIASLSLGLLVLFEWHLVWASVSGMETLLMGLIAAAVFLCLESGPPRYGAAGLLVGIGMWVRPDALLLLLPLGWTLLTRPQPGGEGKRKFPLLALSGLLLLSLAYLLFNNFSAGRIWPTTFFAKQAEYAELLEAPFLLRVMRLLQPPFVGAGIVLLPGLIIELVRLIHRRRFSELAPFLWIACYIGVYALRLPLTYQHGRYLMPILPSGLVLGFRGFQEVLHSGSGHRGRWVLTRAWRASLGAVTAIFWVLGARAYARDVAVIESEMVTVAQWLKENTSVGVKIAAHDIGAIGFYAERSLLDLAGLISPEVIPIIRDEAALKDLMDTRGVDYFVTFPGWYPTLSTVGDLVYQTDGTFSPEQGGENMAVYLWR